MAWLAADWVTPFSAAAAGEAPQADDVAVELERLEVHGAEATPLV